MDVKMKFALFLTLASVRGGVVPLPKVLEGPSSRTTVIGPDGSQITAFVPGGKIVLEGNPGPLLQGAPEVVAVEGVPQPIPEVVAQPVAEVKAVQEVIQPLPVVKAVQEVIQPLPVVTAVQEAVQPLPVVKAVQEVTEPLPEAKSAQEEIQRVPEVEEVTATVTEVKPEAEKASQSSTEAAKGRTVTEAPTEEKTEVVEVATDSPTVEKVTENPFKVVPLVQEIVPVGIKTVEPQFVAYLQGSHVVPQIGGHYLA